MGMFDYVYVEYPLDIAWYIPEKWSPIIRQELFASGFQTKDLNNTLDTYEISNNGYIFLVERDDFESNHEPKKTKIDYHGYMGIYMPVEINYECEVFVEYKLKFTDGKLVNARMMQPTKEVIDLMDLKD